MKNNIIILLIIVTTLLFGSRFVSAQEMYNEYQGDKSKRIQMGC
jgi:hypothetical protein